MKGITPQEFADSYKEQITDDLREVIANLEGLAAEATTTVHDDLRKQIDKLNNARKVLCEVPPECLGEGG